MYEFKEAKFNENYKTVKLCTCNKCGNVYIDTNPSNESTDWPDWLVEEFKLEELSYINEDITKGCKICKSDSNLEDNVNGHSGGIALQIMESFEL